ncbi:MAG: iron-sulfur cluster assembly scaffold protein [Epsilonproteobacteria bacterium]|nr:MAG: iron-sulfur cluster assembly scaffold protein [Campylobacterota bacterium]
MSDKNQEEIPLEEGVNPETLSHIMEPRNYGKLEDANGVGVALDEKTKEYVIFYIQLDKDMVKKAKFATNGCQDTVVIGSMFTDMIQDNTLDYAKDAIRRMNDKLGTMSTQQQVCADLVFTSFMASLKNFDNIEAGQNEELHMFKMKNSCEGENIE